MVRLHIADKKGDFNTYKYDPKSGEMTEEEKTKWAEYVQKLAREQRAAIGGSMAQVAKNASTIIPSNAKDHSHLRQPELPPLENNQRAELIGNSGKIKRVRK
jgi:hypothetical protein